jgi:8-oxo-dGTP diphosphatase
MADLYHYAYPRPALTVDCVVFGLGEHSLQVLLIRRGQAPFAGHWALPGGFIVVGESPDDAARRELAEETGLTRVYLEQLGTFGDPKRDPREHVVTVAYYALVRLADHRAKAATDASDAAWFAVNELPELAFDHATILRTALRRLQEKVRYHPIGFELLPPAFSLTRLQRMYELILGRPLDKRNFRKKALGLGILKLLKAKEQGVRHRAAQLYGFDRRAYRQKLRDGFSFDL